MKFKGIICALMVVTLLALTGCNINNQTDNLSTTAPSSTTTTTVPSTTRPTVTTTTGGNYPGSLPTTTKPTTTSGDGLLPTLQDTSAVEMKKLPIASGFPVLIGKDRNWIKITDAGVLNGNTKNPMFLLIKNVGEDDILSATITAKTNKGDITFNISYLPIGGSIWAEGYDANGNPYIYSAQDNFKVDSTGVVVGASAAGVSIDRSYNNILKIYASEKDGGRGIFVENVSGKTIKKVVIKYRPISSRSGLYANPYEVVITDFADKAIYYKADSQMHDVYVADVQITY